MEKKCSKCGKVKPLDEFSKQKRGKFGVRAHCKSCMAEYQKQYQEANREKLAEYQKQYYEANREKWTEYQKQYNKERYHSDSLFRMTINVRNRINRAFYYNGYTKRSQTFTMLGCTFEQLKTHLEKQFTEGMSWDNQGEWHIDHIVPLASAKSEKQLTELCHYSNLQPLWAEENLSKGGKEEWQRIDTAGM